MNESSDLLPVVQSRGRKIIWKFFSPVTQWLVQNAWCTDYQIGTVSIIPAIYRSLYELRIHIKVCIIIFSRMPQRYTVHEDQLVDASSETSAQSLADMQIKVWKLLHLRHHQNLGRVKIKMRNVFFSHYSRKLENPIFLTLTITPDRL